MSRPSILISIGPTVAPTVDTRHLHSICAKHNLKLRRERSLTMNQRNRRRTYKAARNRKP